MARGKIDLQADRKRSTYRRTGKGQPTGGKGKVDLQVEKERSTYRWKEKGRPIGVKGKVDLQRGCSVCGDITLYEYKTRILEQLTDYYFSFNLLADNLSRLIMTPLSAEETSDTRQLKELLQA